MEFDQIMKAILGLKDAGIVGKQTEQQTNQKDFQVMPGVAILFERIVQLAQRFHGHTVDCLFFSDALLAVTGNEVEQPQVLVQLGQREPVNLVVVQVMQLKMPEVAQQDVARLLVRLQARKVVLGLLECLGQILATAFVLDQ
jgi:hypothetical protein